ncbi:alkylation response protein AidB-like acyl-CoA dehydrogenase [Polymorphobacter multimanifer]|uniref:Alkylation response protein AidB-like acyl-CoA dehydrogenase n=2 Tax=Polymorphobacter multimanifer TaxID=1070431 RepID=A0A841LFV9_9SPHN|nr:acyl-CoA dehydrogenase family protein [Polymorphobacter multimanifer]MBB6227848.1 alkylation response protein AidB-like acyl-CoA dehydrogenase [Polymorphobacter multimanifer]
MPDTPMTLRWSDADKAFADEVAAFLDAELDPATRDAVQRMTSVYAPPPLALAWQRKLHARGWAAPAWPAVFGGTDWTPTQRYIFTRMMAEADAPPLSPMGLGMCGPVLIGHGTPEQQARFLPPMLSGDDFWCQGYSEPNSGSDLASLRMKAERDGDDFIVTGAKIWTTHAQFADWIFALVRTSSLPRPQQGITFILIDMASPGVTVRPIVSLSGEHVQNEVIFDAVRVPAANVVGRIDDGWTVAKYLMEFERGGALYAPSILARLKRLRRHAPPGSSPRLAAIAAEIDALDALELTTMARLSHGQPPGPMASALKVLGTELSQRLSEIELEAAGHAAAVFQPHVTTPGGPVPGYSPPDQAEGVGPGWAAHAMPKYLNDRAGSIYAGTNEIQRGILWQAISRN